MTKGCVLVIDEEWVFRRAVAVYLRAHQYEVAEAATEAQAWEFLGSNKPSVVVVAIDRRGVDVSFVRRLRAHQEYRDVALLILTIGLDPEIALQAGQLRVARIMTKSHFTLGEMEKAIAEQIQAAPPQDNP